MNKEALRHVAVCRLPSAVWRMVCRAVIDDGRLADAFADCAAQRIVLPERLLAADSVDAARLRERDVFGR